MSAMGRKRTIVDWCEADLSNSAANDEKEGKNGYQGDAADSTLSYSPRFATSPQHSHGSDAENDQHRKAESPNRLA